MSARPSPRETHGLHEDERNRLHALARHERAIRDRERHREHLRVVAALTAAPHAYRTPILHPYQSDVIVDHMLAPGDVDDTGFSDGIV